MSMLCLLLLAAAPLPELWPVPQSIEITRERGFDFATGTPVVIADNATEDEEAALEVLFEAAGEPFPIVRASAHRPGDPAVYVGEPDRHPSFKNRKVSRLIADLTPPGPQGYRLVIARNLIVVAGTDPAGTFYGVELLAQLAKAGRTLPCVEVRDEPDLALRGVFVEGPLTPEQLKDLAALRCNLVVFSSPDFSGLTPDFTALTDAAAKAWKQVFDEARRYHLEPVPQFNLLDGALPLLKRHPDTAEGAIAVDHVVLTGEAWQLLSKHNVIDTKDSPLQVKVSGHDCERGVDFEIDQGLIEAPYSEDNAPWAIRRIPGGAIPDGATVDVTYAYAPPDTAACCPSAPETRAAVNASVGALVKALKPRFIHAGLDTLPALNRDLRCAASGATSADLFAQAVTLLDKAAKEAGPGVRVMLWSDLLNPFGGNIAGTLSTAAAKLPKDAVINLREASAAGQERTMRAIAWCEQLGLSFTGSPGGDLSETYAWIQSLRRAETAKPGLLCLAAGVKRFSNDGPLRLAFGKAWSERSLRTAWPERLNDYFDAALWEPRYEDMLAAVAEHLNRRVLAGVSPKDEFNAFREMLEPLRERLPEGELETGFVERLYRNLTEYLSLEAAFNEKPDAWTPRQLVKLVEAQAAVDPNAEADRSARILATIKSKGLFVPSTILFGPYLLPYRAMTPPPGQVVLEVPGTPQFSDTEHRVEATLDYLAPPGAICRVDFETVGTATLSLEQSNDGLTFTPVQQWTSRERGGVRGPAIPRLPFRARALKIAVDAPAERAVLRTPRVFALKEAAAAVCAFSAATPVLDASFKESAWPQQAQIDGFVRTDRAMFAEAQTTVRLVRTRDTFYLGVYAREPRTDTTAVALTQRDAPVWNEESVVVTIDAGQAEPFCLAVNPLGTRFDSRGGNASWDGAWQAVTKQYAVGWAAEIAIPLAVFGGPPQKGVVWKMNFVRIRHNVNQEQSTWAWGEGGVGDTVSYGKVAF